MEPESLDMVAAGYIVTRRIQRPAYSDASLVPSRLITASECMADMFPSLWALRWTAFSEDERAVEAAKFGVAPDDLPRLIEYMSRALDQREFGWPCVWFSSEAAIAAIKEFVPAFDKLVLMGLGLPRDLVGDFLARATPEDHSGMCTMLRTGNSMASGGKPLGWEILGYEFGGGLHSWLCNSVEKEASLQLGIRPGGNGLLVCEHDARSVVEMIRRGAVGAEPAAWFSFLLAEYNIE
jgi:hypothetical protein